MIGFIFFQQSWGNWGIDFSRRDVNEELQLVTYTGQKHAVINVHPFTPNLVHVALAGDLTPSPDTLYGFAIDATKVVKVHEFSTAFSVALGGATPKHIVHEAEVIRRKLSKNHLIYSWFQSVLEV